jgi:hypothetical protein
MLPFVRPATHGRILMDLAERKGLFNAMALRKEIGTAIPAFAPIAKGDLGERGVKIATFVREPVYS